jgi:cobalt-zinc-cadmium efflux system outer membrane protein
MKTRSAAAALLALSGLCTPAADAQTAPAGASTASFVDPQNGVSLEQAIRRALAEEPSLRSARTTVDVARGMERQAGSRRNPSLSVEYRGQPAGTDNQTTVGLEWPLDLFRREGRTAVAQRETTVAELAVADRERQLASDVRGRFGDVLVAVRDLAILAELADAARLQYESLRSRVEQGASPPLDRDLAEVEWRRLDADRLLQLGRADQAMFELKRILGLSPSDPLRLRETLDELITRESATTTASADVTAERPDVREAEARIRVSEARIDRAERDGRVDMSLFGGYMRMDSAFPQFGLSPAGTPEQVRGQFHYWTGGAMVTLPFFNRNQGEIAASRAERAEATAAHEAVRLAAQTEIAAARSLDQRARQAVQVYGTSVRSLARQNLNVVRQSYELGRATVFDVLAEQKRYLEQERGYTHTLRQAYEARTALKRALGELQ